MTTKPKKYNYYTIDTGFLGAPVKLCFDKDAFQDILKDHSINTKEQALGLGIAETHSFTEGRNGLIVVVFDYEEVTQDDDYANIFSTVTHESVHIFHRIMDWIGEEEPGEEIQAYLTEYLVKQIIKGFITERDKRAGEANRKASKRPSKKVGRDEFEVALDHLRRAGQNSLSKPADLSD